MSSTVNEPLSPEAAERNRALWGDLVDPPVRRTLYGSSCSLNAIKAEFDKVLAAMSDEQIIEAFREAGCEVTINRIQPKQ